MGQENNVLKLTKVDVAKRQLRTAIELWFADGDPVSIHTLTAAALEVISALLKRKGLNSHFYDSDRVKPEFRKEFNRRMRENANFFKHADLDPDAQKEFKPELNPMLMIFAVSGIEDLEEKESDGIERLFTIWMLLHHPHLLNQDLAGSWNNHAASEIVRKMSKKELYQTYKDGLTWFRIVPP